MAEIKFSISGKKKTIKDGALKFDKENLSTEQLNELFNNVIVKNNVTHLQLTNCNIKELPDSILNLKKLRKLYLHDSEITTFKDKRDKMEFIPNSFKILPKYLDTLPLEEIRLEQIDINDPDNKESTDPYGYVTRTGINNDKHNMEILYNISTKKLGERSFARVYVNNYFGGLQLIKGRNQNKRRLLQKDFEELKEKYNLEFKTPLIKPSIKESTEESIKPSTQRSRSSSRQRSSASARSNTLPKTNNAIRPRSAKSEPRRRTTTTTRKVKSY